MRLIVLTMEEECYTILKKSVVTFAIPPSSEVQECV